MSFLEEVKDRESPNSHVVDEIPPTLGFDSQMPQAQDVESPNSHVAVEINLDDNPLTLSFDFVVPCLHVVEVSPFHVIFYLNKILITTCSIEVLASSFFILD